MHGSAWKCMKVYGSKCLPSPPPYAQARPPPSPLLQVTLLGLWLMPAFFCIQLHFWRFLTVSVCCFGGARQV